MPLPAEFFDLQDFDHKDIFVEAEEVWTALDRLKDYLASFFREASWPLAGVRGQIAKPLAIHEGRARYDVEIKMIGPKRSVRAYADGEELKGAAIILAGAHLFDDEIILGGGTVVEPGALIKGPAVIGRNCEIRQGAYLRGECLTGDGCVIGHTTEIKGSIFLNGAKAGHFAYIGDSILGKDVNLGAGTKLANLKMIPGSVIIPMDRKRYNTQRRKLGAILGDRTETGCNSVTSPGTLMGPRCIVYPALAVPNGYYPGGTVLSPGRECLRIRSLGH